jgi:hypothetical protein
MPLDHRGRHLAKRSVLCLEHPSRGRSSRGGCTGSRSKGGKPWTLKYFATPLKLPWHRCRLHEIETAFNTLDAYIQDLIVTRRVELKEREQTNCERRDVFRLMIRANEGEGILAMKDEELVRIEFFLTENRKLSKAQIGNTFLMLLAGHGIYERLSGFNFLTDLGDRDHRQNSRRHDRISRPIRGYSRRIAQRDYVCNRRRRKSSTCLSIQLCCC